MQTQIINNTLRGRPALASALLQNQPALRSPAQQADLWQDHLPDCVAERDLHRDYDLLAEAVNGFTTHLHAMAEDIKSAANLVGDSTAIIQMNLDGSAVAMEQHRQEPAGQIGAVISVISDLTRKTNRLALNATLAANRTGVQSGGIAWAVSNIRHVASRQWD